MILADTAIWVDHLHRGGEEAMVALLDEGEIALHPHVIGEIALGSLRNRAAILRALRALRALPQAMMADEEEVRVFIERHRLFGTGIGYVDAHLLASALLTPDTKLWTRDRRLHEAADRLGVAAEV